MRKLPFLIFLLDLFLCAPKGMAQHVTFSYQTFPKFTTQQATSAVQKSIMESTENLSIEQLYTMGEEGLGDSGTGDDGIVGGRGHDDDAGAHFCE